MCCSTHNAWHGHIHCFRLKNTPSPLHPVSFKTPALLCETMHQHQSIWQRIRHLWKVDFTKKWERIGSYELKFVENFIQAISRDILCYAMKILRHCFIVKHIHDEPIIECPRWPESCLRTDGKISELNADILLCTDDYKTDFSQENWHKNSGSRYIAGCPILHSTIFTYTSTWYSISFIHTEF